MISIVPVPSWNVAYDLKLLHLTWRDLCCDILNGISYPDHNSDIVARINTTYASLLWHNIVRNGERSKLPWVSFLWSFVVAVKTPRLQKKQRDQTGEWILNPSTSLCQFMKPEKWFHYDMLLEVSSRIIEGRSVPNNVLQLKSPDNVISPEGLSFCCLSFEPLPPRVCSWLEPAILCSGLP